MWVFVLSRKITGVFTREQELNALNADFPKNVFKHVGKTRALVMVPVDGDPLIEEIQLLADNSRLIPGGATLAWFQKDLREDILRTIEENEAKEKSTDDLKAEAMRGLADLLGSMGQLRGFAGRLPKDLKQKMQDHAKKCTDPDCGVTRIIAEDDKGEKMDAAPTGGGPFQVGDIVRVRKWEGRVEGLLWRDGNGLGMESLLDKDLIISSIQTGDEPGKFVADFEGVLPYVIPTSQLDLVRRPSSEPAPAGAAPVKVGDKVTWRDGASHVWTGTAIKPFPTKTPFTELPPTVEKFTDDLLSGVNRTAEYSHHDRFIVEMVEGGEMVCAAPRADMLKVVQAATPDAPGATAFRVGDKVTIVSGFESAELIFRDDMEPLVGKQGTVVRVSDDGDYAVKVDGDGSAWYWPASSLNLTEPAPTAAPSDSPQQP